MRVIRFLMALCLSVSAMIVHTSEQSTYNISSTLETIDQIIVIIFAEQDTVIITQSDLNRPNLDGSARTIDDLIFENLVYLDAKRFGMAATVENGERYFKMLQRANNRSQDELKEVFAAAGYTYEEALIQLARLSIINEMLDFRIRSRLIVPEKEVIAYYNANPITESASYFVERLLVPYPQMAIKNMTIYKKVLRDQIATGKVTNVEKIDFWVKESELAEDKSFIPQLSIGEISQAQEVEDGFEFFIVKEQRPERVIALEERRLDIIRELTQPRYEKLFAQYRDGLKENATIVHYDKE